jgi:phosphoglycolate phosphatase
MTRLVLWDIDHTLIQTGGVGREISGESFEIVTGLRMKQQAAVQGVTEPVIFRETARLHGLETGRGEFEAFAQALTARHVARAAELAERGHALPGAAAALSALAEQPDVVQTTVTGNVRGAAQVKLAAFGLDTHIDFTVGAYGEDDEVRGELVRIAAARAGAKHGVPFAGGDLVLFGDTPADVEAGVRNGAFVVAVASGKSSAAELERAGADVVLEDLTDTARIVALVTGGRHGTLAR